MTQALRLSGSSPNKRHLITQQGVSLVELMVGVTIGLMVVLAALGTLVTSRQGSTTVTESYRLNSAGNLAMRLMGNSLRQAGAVELEQPGGPNSPVMFSDISLRANESNPDQIVGGTDGGNSPDTLTVAFTHRNAEVTRDCLGNSPGNGPARIENTFAVTGTELRCTGSANPAAPQTVVGDNTEIAVEDFQVWYWISNAGGDQQRRLTATEVEAAAAWGAVQAIEVCLQLRGVRSDYPTAGRYPTCEGENNADGRLHPLFRHTFRLRNRQG